MGRTCDCCGKEEVPKKEWYCRKCYFRRNWRKKNPLEKKVCPICEREFMPKRSNKEIYDSDLCRYTAQLLANKKRYQRDEEFRKRSIERSKARYRKKKREEIKGKEKNEK